MKGSGKEDEGRVATVYVLSINRFANELMPYIITSPAHQNLISNHSIPILSMTQHIMLPLSYPVHISHVAPSLLLLFMFIPHPGDETASYGEGRPTSHEKRRHWPRCVCC